jgi:chromodomain-helicase-DNA-binding protein 7
MARVLDVVEDHLTYQGYPFDRIDGRVTENDRQAAIEHFNRDPEAFVFLLSARAGGVGINLTGADTVIIYDSDWNPHNDIQAQARCHRIGQKAAVKVYRLVSRGTYENKMLERASRKLGLSHAILDGRDPSREAGPMKTEEIEEMIRHGVHGILNDDDTEADRFCAADIDQILSRRARVFRSDVITGGGSLFARAAFDSEASGPDLNAADFWSQVFHGIDDLGPPVSVRRCRQQKTELPQTTDIDGAQSVRRIANGLIDRGFRGSPGEAWSCDLR